MTFLFFSSNILIAKTFEASELNLAESQTGSAIVNSPMQTAANSGSNQESQQETIPACILEFTSYPKKNFTLPCIKEFVFKSCGCFFATLGVMVFFLILWVNFIDKY